MTCRSDASCVDILIVGAAFKGVLAKHPVQSALQFARLCRTLLPTVEIGLYLTDSHHHVTVRRYLREHPLVAGTGIHTPTVGPHQQWQLALTCMGMCQILGTIDHEVLGTLFFHGDGLEHARATLVDSLYCRILHKSLHDSRGLSLTVEGAQFIATWQTLGLPIEDTTTVTVGLGLRLTNHAGQLATALLHQLRMLFVHFEARLHNHHVASVFLAAIADIAHAVGDDTVGIQLRVLFACPVGIERHADHVPLAAIFLHNIKVIVIERLLVTAVQVDDDDALGEDLLHGIVACADEASVSLGVFLDMSHRPEHAVGCLIAHLHPARRNAILLQQGEHVDGMFPHVALHLLEAVSLPGGGNALLLGVGPRVAVVEVHHQVHIQRLYALGHGQQLVFVAAATTRIHPDTHSDGRYLIVGLQQFQALTLPSVAIMELDTTSLLSLQESHVGALYEICFLSTAGKWQADKKQ